jgi:RNA recognition motif-containing protein
MTMIYVGNLADDTSTARTRALFEPYGEVQSVRLSRSESGRRFGAHGLVEMDDEAARAAIAELDGRVLDGTVLSVREALPPAEREAPATTTAAPDDVPPSNLLRRTYEVASIEKVPAPGNVDSDDWYRYVLTSGPAQITGLHRGTLEEVREYASQCADAFNLRSLTGKVTRPLAPPRKR